jgi:hypothetical protein
MLNLKTSKNFQTQTNQHKILEGQEEVAQERGQNELPLASQSANGNWKR